MLISTWNIQLDWSHCLNFNFNAETPNLHYLEVWGWKYMARNLQFSGSQTRLHIRIDWRSFKNPKPWPYPIPINPSLGMGHRCIFWSSPGNASVQTHLGSSALVYNLISYRTPEALHLLSVSDSGRGICSLIRRTPVPVTIILANWS